MRTIHAALVLALAAPFSGASLVAQTDYRKDVEFALDEMKEQCGHFFKDKGIDWRKVEKQFRKDAKKIKTDQDHYVLLVRLVARLRDGHASVRKLEKGADIEWPDDPGERRGPGMFWCRVGKKTYVKNSWSTAKAAGVEPGMQIVKVDGKPVDAWLDARIAELSDKIGFSTDHQALFYAHHWGLADAPGTRMKLDLKDPKGKSRKRTVTYGKASYVANGPAYYPKDVERKKDLTFGRTEGGFGYVHVRRCKGDLPEQIDAALKEIGDVSGMILDFRGNSGGGFDHDALMGRFVPAGNTLAFAKRYQSAGPNPYGGRMVVIVDATARSAGETAAGIFSEDGRAYMIGESPTAGMSSQKTTIELPSGLFALYVSVRSNKGRFNKGRGIEGIGVVPLETVAFDPEDLAAERDTLIARAEQLLQDFPQKKVPYDPAKFGVR